MITAPVIDSARFGRVCDSVLVAQIVLTVVTEQCTGYFIQPGKEAPAAV